MNKSLLSYVGFAAAVISVLCGVIKPEWADTAWLLAGLLGYGSVEILRLQVVSKGWVTHSIVAVVVITGLLQIFGVIQPEIFQSLITAFAPVTGISIQKSLANASVIPKVN